MEDEQIGKQPFPVNEEKEIIPAPVTIDAMTTEQPITPVKENEEVMEVHTHGHLHETKKWKEYLFQFLMLFLAVFCGFLAENYREHYVEHLREKQFINSLVEDIKSDTTKLSQLTSQAASQLLMLDSLLAGIADKAVVTNSRQAHHQWLKSRSFSDFIQNDRTIQQLKSSGSLRLIRNKAVSDSIMRYDQAVKNLVIHQQSLNTYLTNQSFWFGFFDFINIKTSQEQVVPLTAFGKEHLNEAYADRSFWKSCLDFLVYQFRLVNENGKRLVVFINKEYRLDEESR